MNSKNTALYFSDKENGVQAIVVKSGFSNDENDPFYHILIEQWGKEESQPTITTLLYTASQCIEKLNLSIDPDRFQETIVDAPVSSIITDLESTGLKAEDVLNKTQIIF